MRGLGEVEIEGPTGTTESRGKDGHVNGPGAIESRTDVSRYLAPARAAAEAVFGPTDRRDFALRYWNGEAERPAGDTRFTIVLNRPSALRQMLLPPSELRIAEAYVHGAVDVEGDLEAATTIGDRVRHRLDAIRIARAVRALLSLPRESPVDRKTRRLGAPGLARRHSRGRDRAAVRSHYDVGNEFYSLFLDERLVYSCGYFPTGEESLDVAQIAKLEHLCRKLRLRRGERLLDVGCGWGALVRHAAARHGVDALGITLSDEQATLARDRVTAEHLAERCHVDTTDYRDLSTAQPFDKVVSVGMFEHVGRSQLRAYFERMFALTRPGGLFLNHGIVERGRGHRGILARLGGTLWREGRFIDRYVFPDGELVRLDEVIAEAERAGFETRDVESLREHYALTLRHWVRRLEAAQAEATRLVGAVTYRVWRLYMAASAHAFASGRLNLAQVLFAKPDLSGRASLPPTRADLYA